VHAATFYADHDIDLRCATAVTTINSVSRTVNLEPGEELAYDRLLLATGARPRHLSN
jgi:3-phenylpropionate/trans-cinnamate dioxygenase ferredoxin reductase subunit